MLQVFPGQFEKRARVLAEVVHVEHRLRVHDIWKVDCKMHVDAVTKLEVWDISAFSVLNHKDVRIFAFKVEPKSSEGAASRTESAFRRPHRHRAAIG